MNILTHTVYIARIAGASTSL